MAVVEDLAAPLPAVGVADAPDEAEDGVTETLGVGVADDGTPEGVGLAGADPVGVADGVLDGCVVAFRDEWPLNVSPKLVPEACPPETTELSGLPMPSSNTVMPAMTTRKNPAAMPP